MTTVLFFILIALFPLGVLLKFSIMPSVQVSAVDMVVTLILLLSVKKIVLFLRHNGSVYVKLLSAFFAISLLGVVLNTSSVFQFISSISYLLRMYAYILLLIPLMEISRKKLMQLRMGMILSGFAFILIGYIQYIYYPNLRNLFYLGWDEHLYRLFSTFFDPNFTGSFILLILFIYVSFYMENLHVGIRQKIIITLPFLIMIPALFLTYSRSAIFSGAIMTVVFLVLIRQKKLIAIFFVISLLMLFILPKNFGGEGVNLMRTASIFTRLQSNSQAITIFKDNPIIGVGFNTLRFTQDRYNFVLKSEVLTSHAAAGFPNSYLVALSTTGIFGFSLFVAFFYNLVRKLYLEIKKTRQSGDKKFYFYVSTLTVTLGLLFNSMFENVLFYAPIMIWLTLLFGIYLGGKKSS